jgi:hypothetical protein
MKSTWRKHSCENSNFQSNAGESRVHCLELANRGSRVQGSSACMLPRNRGPLSDESPVTKPVRDDPRQRTNVDPRSTTSLPIVSACSL